MIKAVVIGINEEGVTPATEQAISLLSSSYDVFAAVKSGVSAPKLFGLGLQGIFTVRAQDPALRSVIAAGARAAPEEIAMIGDTEVLSAMNASASAREGGLIAEARRVLATARLERAAETPRLY